MAAQPMPDLSPPVPLGREAVCCPLCLLTQYVTAAQVCRRCKASYAPKPVAVASKEEPDPVERAPRSHDLTLQERIAANLKQARLSAGLSQRQAAERVGCPRTYISKIEHGGLMPTITTLGRLATAYGVTIAQIVGEQPLFEPWAVRFMAAAMRLTETQRVKVLGEMAAMAAYRGEG